MVLGVESNYVTHENKQFFPCARNQFFITAIQNFVYFSSSSLRTKSKQKFMFIRFQLAKFKKIIFITELYLSANENFTKYYLFCSSLLFLNPLGNFCCVNHSVSLLTASASWKGETYYKHYKLYNFRGKKLLILIVQYTVL